jgi:uncharacterized radical SAM superfamily Fe-S cluster-containing enzyme
VRKENYDEIVIKAKCPEHGKFTSKFNANVKAAWMDGFAKAVLRCMKCEEIGAASIVKEKTGWIWFKIKCPIHGLTKLKKVVDHLFYLVVELDQLEISYKELLLQKKDIDQVLKDEI